MGREGTQDRETVRKNDNEEGKPCEKVLGKRKKSDEADTNPRRSQRIAAITPTPGRAEKMGRKGKGKMNDLEDDDEIEAELRAINATKSRKSPKKKSGSSSNQTAERSSVRPSTSEDNNDSDQDQDDEMDEDQMDEFMSAVLRAAASTDASILTDESNPQRAALLHAVFGKPNAESISSSSAAPVAANPHTGGNSSGRYADLLKQLKSSTPAVQLIALQELAESLSIATEDMFSGYGRTRMHGFDTREFTHALVNLVKGSPGGGFGGMMDMDAETAAFMMEDEDFGGFGGGGDSQLASEVMLLACRCLSNLIEANPSSTSAILCGRECGGVTVLIGKLREIEYIELAEQVLSVLDKICVDYPFLIVQENGLSACLQYLDFFGLHVQRTATSIVAKSCKGLGLLSPGSEKHTDALSKLQEIIPTLEQLLSNGDSKIVHNAVSALDAIVSWCYKDESTLETLVSASLLLSIMSLLKPGVASITGGLSASYGSAPRRSSATSPGVTNSSGSNSNGNFVLLVKVLVHVCKGSPSLSSLLLGDAYGVPDSIFSFFAGGNGVEANALNQVTSSVDSESLSNRVMNSVLSRGTEEIQQVLILASELLPPLPDTGLWCMLPTSKLEADAKEPAAAPSARTLRSKASKSSIPRAATTTVNLGNSFETRQRRRHASINPDTKIFTEKYALRLLPALIEVFGTSMHAGIRRLALEAVAKALWYVQDSAMLSQVLLETRGFGKFVFELLSLRSSAIGNDASNLGSLSRLKNPANTATSAFSGVGGKDQIDALLFLCGGLQVTCLVVDKCGTKIVGWLIREGILSEVRKIVDALETSGDKGESDAGQEQMELEDIEPPASSPSKRGKNSTHESETAGGSDRVLRSRKKSEDGKGKATTATSVSEPSTGFFEGVRMALGRMSGSSASTSATSTVEASTTNAIQVSNLIIALNGESYPEAEVRAWLLEQASSFLKSLGENKSADLTGSDSSFDVLSDLKKCAKVLKGCKAGAAAASKAGNAENRESSAKVEVGSGLCMTELRRVAEHFAGVDTLGIHSEQMGVTGFEVLESGIIDALITYLSSPGSGESGAPVNTVYTLYSPRLSRLAAFLHIFVDGVHPVVGAESSFVPNAFKNLVLRLQECLSRVEDFQVLVAIPTLSSDVGRSSQTESLLSMFGGLGGMMASSSTSSLREQANPSLQLARQIRVKLVAENTAGIPSAYQTLMVGIHAIGTVKALEDFLKTKIGGSSVFGSSSGGDDDEEEEANLVVDEEAEDDEDDEGDDDEGAQGENQEEKTGELSENKQDDLIHTEVPPAATSPSKSASGQIPLNGEKPVQTPVTPSASVSAAVLKTPEVTNTLATPVSYANAASASQNSFSIQFSLDDVTLSKESTIFGALYEHERRMQSSKLNLKNPINVWGKSYTIKYKRCASVGQEETLKVSVGEPEHQLQTTIIPTAPYSLMKSGNVPFSVEYSEVIHKDSKQGPVLFLLRILHTLNSDWKMIYDQLAVHLSATKSLPVLGVATAADGAIQSSASADSKSSTSYAVMAPLPSGSFICNKITSKLNRQLNEPLIIASKLLPKWCAAICSEYLFLVPFETRLVYLQSTAFGYSRSISRWRNNEPNSSASQRRETSLESAAAMIGRISRQKVRISRARLIDSMVRVTDLISKNVSSSLEVEFYDEVGTGLGPTMEFYSSVCKELRKRGGVSVGDLDSAGSSPSRSSIVSLWRENTGVDEYLNVPEGLFPRPMSAEMLASDEGRKRLSVFKAMGAFIAKSLLDNRIVDLPLSSLLLRLAVWGFATADGATVPSLLEMIKDVDVSLCNSLTYIHKYVEAKLEIELNSDLTASARSLAISNITIKNASIDDLSLDYTLPGYSDVEIKSAGSEISITMENVGEYVSSVANMTVVEGVRQQIQAFRHGFDTVFPISSLQSFSVPELSLLFGGSHDEDWSILTIMEAIKADHGYTSDSRTVHDLAALMHSFSNLERREFLMFVTGSPKLPIGGFKSLSPPLTVVRKGSDYGLKADAYLPSVMTCVNYLKVPAYSDLEVMRQRFEIAIKEGQGSFHLS